MSTGTTGLTPKQQQAIAQLHDAHWQLDAAIIGKASAERRPGLVRDTHARIESYQPDPRTPAASEAKRLGLLACATLLEVFPS